MITEEIRIYGTVQGVGFRPTVYRLAKKFSLKGKVYNDGEGVVIHVSGKKIYIEEFIQNLYIECPPLAKITKLTRQAYLIQSNFLDFSIAESLNTRIKTEISPDAATCPQCQKEIFDPLSRYFRYPFTNCTHCGPRLSIINAIPYDRKNTSMAAFGMCAKCSEEYQDIENRRFHAQPVACYTCGPSVWLERADGRPITASMFSMMDDIDAACTLLQKGEIVAIKGIGGIHLACDATNETAVNKLRDRKKRHHKPFALMARDIKIIEQYCTLNQKEIELLESPAAPIVLLRKKSSSLFLPLYPFPYIGFMLPYTPLHHLILRRMNRPIVLTSGNIADEPQCIDNDIAKKKLSQIADYFLLHNREIVNRVDDSVVRVIENKVENKLENKILIIRRARGYTPIPINLPPGFDTLSDNLPHILAMGSELKNTFCLLQNGRAILSQHLGNLQTTSTFKSYQNTLNLYLNLYQHQPRIIATDKHPEYLSTKLGKQLVKNYNQNNHQNNQIQLHQIQHHHAHIAACMAENKLPLNSPPVLGIALDGLGYGEDKTLWGGEFLLADYRQFKRLASLKPVPMIGGEKAIYQPWRNTYTHLNSNFNWNYINTYYSELEIIKFFNKQPLKLINQILEQNLNSPLSSSTGRLFDAVAAAIGICREECSYEGQAAIEIEALVDRDILNSYKYYSIYPLRIEKLDNIYVINSDLMWKALLDDLKNQISPSIIATKFHLGFAKSIVKMATFLCSKNTIDKIVLTGGVFQNCILLEQVTKGLQKLGITVLTHSLVPPNDGGLSLGQAVITAAREISYGRSVRSPMTDTTVSSHYR
ncbi:MAG: carbamoyltransferase HypF [Cyanobacteria bacterium P01_A01_bin.84]